MKYSRALACLAISVVLAVAASAAEPESPNAYEDDPAILKVLEGLGDNEAAVLPASGHGPSVQKLFEESPGLQGRYRGGPGTRDYCNKLPYAADRQTVLYAGGSHQTYRPNDVWEYHLGSNTWHVLFAPDGGNHTHMKWTLYGTLRKLQKDPDTKLTEKEQTDLEETRRWWKANVVLKDGALTTRKGGPIMPAHTGDAFTYDPGVGRLLWASGAHPGGKAIYHSLLTGIPLKEVEQQLHPDRTPMWMFDADDRRWIEYRTSQPAPQFRGMGATMHYLPDLKKSIYYVAATNVVPQAFEMWMFDAGADKWEELLPNGGKDVDDLALREKVAPMSEQQVAYSPRHRKLVAVIKHDTFVYDVAKNEWSKVATDERIFGHDARSTFVYDEVGDVFLLSNPREENALAAFSLEDNRWEILQPDGSAVPKKAYGAYKGFYHPVHNVFVLHCENRGTNWVYRYRRRTAE